MTDVNRNYTSEQTAELLALYSNLGNDGIEQIAQTLQKPVKSVISKLVREGVYVSKPRNISKRTSASKKELLNELETIVGFDTTGLANSTKDSLSQLLLYIKKSSLSD